VVNVTVKRREINTSCLDWRDERQWTTDDASKGIRWHRNWGREPFPGSLWRVPADWPWGVRCTGGV